jgi:hypothetical protein
LAAPLQQQELETARKLAREARADPHSPYARKYVGILDGKVVVVADSPEEGLEQLRQLDPDPDRGILVDTRVDYDAQHDVWRA